MLQPLVLATGEHQSSVEKLEGEDTSCEDTASVFVSNRLCAVKPSKPQCWMEGKLLAGSDVKMSCKSADGSDPIKYKWERVLDKGKYLGKLPPLAVIGKSTNTLEYLSAYC